MPLYMDRHDLPGATAADIATAHLRDLEVQERFGVRFVTYWFEEEAGSGFCLIEGPDKESVEAAQVDGATWWTQFRYIELHYLRPLFLLILFFRVADVLRVFDHVYILTGGGPGTATQLLSLYIYRIEFRFFDGGQAAALAVMVLVSISILYSLVTRALPLERA